MRYIGIIAKMFSQLLYVDIANGTIDCRKRYWMREVLEDGEEKDHVGHGYKDQKKLRKVEENQWKKQKIVKNWIKKHESKSGTLMVKGKEKKKKCKG